MGNVMKVFFLLLIFIGGAYISGVRVHPEAFSASVPSISSQKGVELLFKDGQRATGQIVKEIPGGILFNMEGAEITFTNDEIVSRTEVSIPSSAPIKHAKAATPFITYDPSISLFNQIAGKTPEKKPAFQASSLWGAKPRSSANTNAMPGTMSSAKSADPNSLTGIYQKSMSKDSLDQWKSQAVEALNGQGRNPFVEARNAAQAKAAAGNTAKSEAKLKELEESGY